MQARVCLPGLSLLVAGLLVGCGGGSSTSTPAVPLSPAAAPTQSASVSSADTVAFVSGTPISKASYEHWVSVEKALGAAGSPSHQALGFLITSEWVLGEAAARGITVSEAEVKRHYAQLLRQSFPKAGSLQKYLAKAGETEADLLVRLKVELLASRIAAKVTAGRSAAQPGAALTGFEKNFHEHWKRLTSCNPGYVMEDCNQYKGKGEHLTASGSASPASSSGTSGTGGSSASSSSTSSSGQVYNPPPGSFAISSPDFERNGEIPAKYTCDGANVSPPLQWQNVPAKAAALVLFVIDNSISSPASTNGIRWVVGDINPKSKGVAAGKTPEGGIVGLDTQGHTGYGGICPPHGKTSNLELVMYALKRKIPLSPGFTAATAEREYGAGKALLGSGAVTYVNYHRP